jgi:hypothetical protein
VQPDIHWKGWSLLLGKTSAILVRNALLSAKERHQGTLSELGESSSPLYFSISKARCRLYLSILIHRGRQSYSVLPVLLLLVGYNSFTVGYFPSEPRIGNRPSSHLGRGSRPSFDWRSRWFICLKFSKAFWCEDSISDAWIRFDDQLLDWVFSHRRISAKSTNHIVDSWFCISLLFLTSNDRKRWLHNWKRLYLLGPPIFRLFFRFCFAFRLRFKKNHPHVQTIIDSIVYDNNTWWTGKASLVSSMFLHIIIGIHSKSLFPISDFTVRLSKTNKKLSHARSLAGVCCFMQKCSCMHSCMENAMRPFVI